MENLNLFDLPKVNPEEFTPAVWAYVGDAIYELFIRCYLLTDGPAKTKTLHREATLRVRASFQANLIRILEPYLTESELEVVKRGRNAKSGNIPSYTDVITYRYSTAFESLIGYLYLSGRYSRMSELLNKALELNGGVSHDKS